MTLDENTEAALVAAARKELAYLEQFGRPLLPFQRERREAYGYKEQSPSDHIKNLEELSPPSFPYPPSRSPAEQRHRVDVVRL